MYHGFNPQSLAVKRCPGILEQWMIIQNFCHPFQRLRKFPYEKYITFGFLDMAKGIDHIFVSKDITHNIINLTISDDIFAQSRHKTVTLEIANLFENPLGVRINDRIPDNIWSIQWFKLETEGKISTLLNNFSNENYDKFIFDTTNKASKISRNLRRETFLKLSTSKNRDEIYLLKSKLALLSTSQTRNSREP